MALNSTFTEIKLDDLMNIVKQKYADGYRFVQVLCTRADNGIDMTYTFNKGNDLENYNIRGIDTKTTTVPSVTDYYLVAFPFENEAHDLFGVNITGMAIDFHGTFYTTRIEEPMTVMSPAQKAAKEKAARIAKAKAAKAAKDAVGQGGKDDGIDAEMEAKLAAMDPEKAARIRAALKAKAAKAAKDAAGHAGTSGKHASHALEAEPPRGAHAKAPAESPAKASESESTRKPSSEKDGE